MTTDTPASPLTLFDLLTMVDAAVTPERVKIHLATHNGREDPLDVYSAGGFDAWQAYQTKKNFNRAHVVTLIALPERDRWLFVGAYDVGEHRPAKREGHVIYAMDARPSTAPLAGRLVVAFTRSGRASYLRAERWAESAVVAELRARPMKFAEFPGYIDVELSHGQLRSLVREAPAS